MTKNANKTRRYNPKRIILFLLVFILINPIVLYLLSSNILVSIILPFGILMILLLLEKNKKLKPISVLFFNLILILSIFIHAETIFTINFREYIIEELYEVKGKYYFNRPYLDKTFRDKEFIVQYKTNKQGFRIGAEDEPETSIKEVDWLFIGDSYTQGAQVQFEELYTSKLFEHFPEKIIVNTGISGMGLPEEFNYFINEGVKLKPKRVFLQICNFNDFMNVKENQAGFSDYLMHYSNLARYLLYEFKFANPAELPLGRWTEPFYPDEKSNEDFNIFYKTGSNKKKKDLRNFEIYLKKINDAVKEIGAELFVVQIPTKEQIYYKYFDEVISSFKIKPEMLDMHYANVLLSTLCKKNGIKHIDLLDDFSNAQQDLFFQFDEHLNANGHAQMAFSINKFLTKLETQANSPSLLSILNVGDRYPNFSLSDCNLLSFQSIRDRNCELFLADSLFQKVKRLTWNNVDEIHPWLSTDNSKIIFTEGNQEENKTNVVLMNIDGSERRYITDGKHTFGAIPSFSYDGSKITYAEWRKDESNGQLTNPYIVVIDLIKDVKQIVTSDSVESWRPIFSPDNSKLYFISKQNNNQFDIIEYSILSNVKKNITNSEYEEWDPAISRDGKSLLYSAKIDDNWDLMLIQLESGNKTRLSKTIGNEWDATFSPCNQYIYYSGTFGFRNGIFRRKL